MKKESKAGSRINSILSCIGELMLEHESSYTQASSELLFTNLIIHFKFIY